MQFQKRVLLNYIIGSLVAVFGVGSVFIFNTLELTKNEMMYLIIVMIISAISMVTCEMVLYKKHIKPIKKIFVNTSFTSEELEAAVATAHNFPILTVKRILGPHLFGLAVPATIITTIFIFTGILSIPFYAILFAWAGAILVAVMHALIEYFLTYAPIQKLLPPLLEKMSSLSELDCKQQSIRTKLLASSLFIALFPVLLFFLAFIFMLTEIEIQGLAAYISWASVIIIVITGISISMAMLLYKNINHPLQVISAKFQSVQQGVYVNIDNVYTDEFSSLVTGFNHMVQAIKQKDDQNSKLVESLFNVFAVTLDARDKYTAGHSNRVAALSVKIARKANFKEKDIELLRKSALLHDIGKIGVSDAVLLKDGRLTEDEFAQIKQHPTIGVKILEQIQLTEELKPILLGVKHHHERFDGNGYPDRVSGYNIPAFGRVMAVADAFDAMTSDRPYRKGMPVEKALKILEEGKGTQWDPYFIDLFLEIMKDTYQ
ncbi:HD domain-containing protein [Bacillus sp. HMF5848]|uniref:HD-GYP domain-containing protein n=1 Tax=Bacillus sp. HMF5848 TaxID=2495421 RepID=UPI000F78A531|nr:HD domain-containing phosphohydrolase [Bacillus sp. HMF5848]RSK25965.1 HD domain-containing protein [Bacillus sp. HMF5848]